MTTDATFGASDQVREYSERATETTRAFGRQAIDAYEQVVRTAVEFERAAAGAVPAEWMRSAIGAHATFVADINSAYVGAVRSVLS